MKRWMVAIAACGSPAAQPQPPHQPVEDVAGECAKAGTNIARVLAVHDDRLVEVVASHCKADHWTADARTCVGAAVDHDAALQCAHKHMTEEQHELVVNDMRPLLPDMQPEQTTLTMIERITTAMADLDSLDSFRDV